VCMHVEVHMITLFIKCVSVVVHMHELIWDRISFYFKFAFTACVHLSQ